MPATAQPRLPSTGLARCQTSSKASGAAPSVSRMAPWKRTLATYCLLLGDVEQFGVERDDVGLLRAAAALLDTPA
jgi:hypothetical protein